MKDVKNRLVVLVLALAAVLGLGWLGYLWQAQQAFQRYQFESQQRLARFTSHTRFERPVLSGRPLAGNGAQAYWQIVGRERVRGDQMFKARLVLPEDLREIFRQLKTPAGQLKYGPILLPVFGPYLEQLRQAGQYSFVQFEIPWRVDATLPDVTLIQHLGYLQLAQARLACQERRWADVHRIALQLWRYAQDLQALNRLSLLPALSELQRQTLTQLDTCLKQPLKPAEQRLLGAQWRLLAEVPNRAVLIRQSELLVAEQTLLQMANPDHLVADLATETDDLNPDNSLWRRLERWLRYPALNQAYRYLQQLRELQEAEMPNRVEIAYLVDQSPLLSQLYQSQDPERWLKPVSDLLQQQVARLP